MVGWQTADLQVIVCFSSACCEGTIMRFTWLAWGLQASALLAQPLNRVQVADCTLASCTFDFDKVEVPQLLWVVLMLKPSVPCSESLVLFSVALRRCQT